MPDQDDPKDNGKLNQEEIRRLIQQKTLDTLRGIDGLIEEHQYQNLAEESEQDSDCEQNLYLRWKKEQLGEEE
jgi:hypothetical protein